MNFFKTTLMGGLLILLPLLLLWVGIDEIVGLLVALATPIADLVPGAAFEDLVTPGLVAVLLIMIASFVLGLAARSRWLSRLGHRIELSVIDKIPMYRMLKIISRSFLDAEGSEVRPALIKDGAGGGDPCYVVEEHADGRATVMLPWSPASFAGSIKVVQRANLQYLGCTLDEFSRSLSLMGVGVERCLRSEVGNSVSTDR